eukprot:SAG22_NODE_1061_length_5763_cov_3.607345_4_plen_177_part_00
MIAGVPVDEKLAILHYSRAVSLAGGAGAESPEDDAVAEADTAAEGNAATDMLDSTLEHRPVAAAAAALVLRAALWRLHTKQEWRASKTSRWLVWLGEEPELAASAVLALVLAGVFVWRNRVSRAPRSNTAAAAAAAAAGESSDGTEVTDAGGDGGAGAPPAGESDGAPPPEPRQGG